MATEQVSCDPRRWSGPYDCWTPRPRQPGSRSPHRVMSMVDRAEEGPRDWQELLVTVLIVVAALGTSWSSYQATRWNGEQAKGASRTNAIRIEAARAQGLGQAQTQVDVATFIAWANADRRGETALAGFYVDRFRDEFKPAFDAWSATGPLVNADAPATPFVMDQYQVASRQQA